MLGAFGYLFDIIMLAKSHYPDNAPIYWLQIIGAIFYLSCACFIVFPLKKWNKGFVLISFCLLVGMIFLTKILKKFINMRNVLKLPFLALKVLFWGADKKFF